MLRVMLLLILMLVHSSSNAVVLYRVHEMTSSTPTLIPVDASDDPQPIFFSHPKKLTAVPMHFPVPLHPDNRGEGLSAAAKPIFMLSFAESHFHHPKSTPLAGALTAIDSLMPRRLDASIDHTCDHQHHHPYW